ncbi:MAG: ABC transporter ATP-binding protein [Mycoplasmatales bacterium]
MKKAQKNVVEIVNLSKSYEKSPILSNINLTLKQGEILGLIGPNGAGKTTLINCILSLIPYDNGSIKLFDEQILSNQLKPKIGFVTQSVALFDNLNVIENIEFFGLINGLSKKKAKANAKIIIEKLGLSNHIKKYPSKLSGGLQRRVNIACGVVHEPEFIIMDEPTASVDPQSREQIIKYVEELKGANKTIIYTSHYLDEVERISDRITLIDSGVVVISGTKQEILSHNQAATNEVVVTCDDLNQLQPKNFEHIPGVINTIFSTDHVLFTTTSEVSLDQIKQVFTTNGLIAKSCSENQRTLNNIFLELTGKEFKDD